MNRGVLRLLSVLGVFLIFAFCAASVDARGRGGGGRGGGGFRGGGGGGFGGGRSISRGPASYGSFGGSRSYGGRGSYGSRGSYGTDSRTRDLGSQRPSAGTLPSQRPARGDAGLGDRGGARPSTRDARVDRGARVENRPSEARRDRDQIRDDRQERRTQRQEDRQDWADQAREDRQDFWDDEFDEFDEVEGVWYGPGGYYIYDDDWVAGVTVIAIGTAFTFAAFDSMARSSGCAMTSVIVSGATYYRCDPHWYTRVIEGGEPVYVVVAAPPGY